MEYVLSAISIFIEYLSFINLSNAFCKKKAEDKTILSLAVAITFFMVAVTHIFFKDLSFLKSLFIITVNFVFLLLTYRGSTGSMILTVLMYYIFLLVGDTLSIVSMTAILNISFQQLFSNVSTYITITYTSKFILFISTFLLEKLWNRKKLENSISIPEWGLMLTFPVVSYIVLIVIVYTSLISRQSNIFTIGIILGLFLANIATLNIISRLSADRRIKQDYALLNQQVKMSMENVESLMASYEIQRKLTHDFNNHLETLANLIAKKDFANAEKYLKLIDISSEKLPSVIRTNNPITDALLNYKYFMAIKKDISVEFDINDLSDIPMRDEDIVAVLGNAIDNAIEACEKCPGDKQIKIKILTGVYETVISVVNSAAGKVEIVNNEVRTSKSDKMSHGYGLKNIKSILKNYDHTFVLDSSHNRFRLTIVIT